MNIIINDIKNKMIKRLIEYLITGRKTKFYIQKKVCQNRIAHVITLVIRH